MGTRYAVGDRTREEGEEVISLTASEEGGQVAEELTVKALDQREAPVTSGVIGGNTGDPVLGTGSTDRRGPTAGEDKHGQTISTPGSPQGGDRTGTVAGEVDSVPENNTACLPHIQSPLLSPTDSCWQRADRGTTREHVNASFPLRMTEDLKKA